MKQTITKVTVSALLALVCLALFASSAQAVQIRAETGAALPTSIIVNENLTVLITDDAGTLIDGVAENARVRYILPADGGTPIPVDVGSDGKTVNPYKPPMTGVLNITVSYGTTLMASQTVNVISTPPIAIKAEDGGALPTSILVGETFTVLITEDGSPVDAGTNVVFRLPYDTGDPVTVSTDDDGKVNYTPLNTGTLGIRVLDGTVTVAEANVTVTTTGIQTLGSVVISPDSADLSIDETQRFTATCYDTSDNLMSSGYALTWNCDTDAVGTIDSSGLFTAGGVGTATVTATATQGYVTKTDTAIVNVSAPTETVLVDGADLPKTSVEAGTAADITVNGTFDSSVTGSIELTPVAEPEETVGSYAFTGDDVALIGITVTPDAAVIAELADGNDTIRIEICYNATELASKDIDTSTLAIHRYNVTAAAWEKMVAGVDPCVANGRDGYCVWIEVNNLSTFALVGTKTAALPSSRSGGGGGHGGTYPPGWGGTLTATSGVTPGATPGATPGVTPPGEAVTKPTKPAVTEETPSVAEEEAPTKKKPGIPGFTSVFAIAGLLAVAYVLMRRRE